MPTKLPRRFVGVDADAPKGGHLAAAACTCMTFAFSEDRQYARGAV
jgi:hypothetical protein